MIVNKAVGAKEGKGKIFRSEGHILSSMSEDWIEKVKDSGRFKDKDWGSPSSVEITSLDRLISEYGKPDFVKIDVEGFEKEVINGLSVAVRALSLEYIAEHHEVTLDCLKRLESLGQYTFNFSKGETMVLEFEEWRDYDGIVRFLDTFRGDFMSFGDVYAKCIDFD